MAAFPSHRPHDAPASLTPETNSSKRKRKHITKAKGKEREHTPISPPVNGIDETKSWSANECCSWDWFALTDPAAARIPPIFTKDGSYFFSLVGSTVKIHSAETGNVVSTMNAPPLSDDSSPSALTSLVLNPTNNFQLITGSMDGRLMFWDFIEATLLRTIEVAQPIQHLCAHSSLPGSVFVTVMRHSKKGQTDANAAVLRVNIAASKPPEVLPVGKLRRPTSLAISPNGLYLVATGGHKVYAAKLSDLGSGFTKFVSPDRLTCLAFHPTEEYFATGDERGNIRLWYCLNDQLPTHARGVEKRTATTSLHWHAHAVSSIAFTYNGAYLVSGGEEAVLVVWQLHTGRKEFVPRVGAPINTVALRHVGAVEEYLLGLSDGTYLFVSAATLKVTKSVSRVKLDSALSTASTSAKDISPPLGMHQLSSTIILPSSHPSSIQIYSPATSAMVSELEVSPSNRISRRDEKPIEPGRVTHVEVSFDGLWMATVDIREGDESFRGEVYLKIWGWVRNSGQWVLNTRVDRPHGLNKVTALSFSPLTGGRQNIQLVSIGEDGALKVWRLRATNNGEDYWVARSTYEFHSHKPTAASWSPDASLLALTTTTHVTLFNPVSNTVSRTIPSPDGTPPHSASFGGRCGRFLVVATHRTLALWDLIVQEVRWQKVLPISRILVDHKNDVLTVFHPYREQAQRTLISVFRTSSPSSIDTRSVPFNLRAIAPSFFPSAFVGITDDWRVVIFGDSIQRPRDEGSTARGLSAEVVSKRSLFQDIFGNNTFSEYSEAATAVQMPSRTTTTGIQRIFDAPAYLLPPIETLYDSLMEDMLQRRPAEIASTSVPVMENDGMDEVMEDSPVHTTAQAVLTKAEEDKEMQTLITFFRSQLLNDPKGTAAEKSNDIPNMASIPPPVSSRTQKPVTPISPLSQEPPRSPPTPVSMVNGKKRKKG